MMNQIYMIGLHPTSLNNNSNLVRVCIYNYNTQQIQMMVVDQTIMMLSTLGGRLSVTVDITIQSVGLMDFALHHGQSEPYHDPVTMFLMATWQYEANMDPRLVLSVSTTFC